ncbi:hypothetical protein BT63DRAFT_458157 [Microthyrium microscopicum]|uniref:Uncharacterized protein n=1 Tax=Microthyrium microscopicum TaxID=703497 RepID=A0A6A6U8H5_9PEZI|nr:hypothetical protein BT63DRAFT_458157 [Microthyrium microscopicum]
MQLEGLIVVFCLSDVGFPALDPHECHQAKDSYDQQGGRISSQRTGRRETLNCDVCRGAMVTHVSSGPRQKPRNSLESGNDRERTIGPGSPVKLSQATTWHVRSQDDLLQGTVVRRLAILLDIGAAEILELQFAEMDQAMVSHNAI